MSPLRSVQFTAPHWTVMLEEVTVDTLTEVGAADGAENSIGLVTVTSYHYIQRYTIYQPIFDKCLKVKVNTDKKCCSI